MKKAICTAAALLLSFVLAGCGAASGTAGGAASKASGTAASGTASSAAASSAAPQASSAANASDHTVAAIKKRGTLVIATESQYAPFCFKDASGKVVGYEPTLMQYIADDLGVKLEVMDVEFTAVIPAVQSGAADIGMAGMVKTPERLEAVDFTNYYNLSGQCVLVLKKNADQYKTMESFAGKTLGAQKGTLQETIVSTQFTSSQAKILPKVPNLIQEVKMGSIDGVVIAQAPAQSYLKANPDLAEADPGIVVDPETNGQVAAVAKGNQDLCAYLNGVIAKLTESGQLKQWFTEAQTLADGMSAG